jgi:protein-S-isoprenylcysteine O-methyltransferase Ste14
MIIDEFFTQLHVIIGVVSLLVTAVGGAMVLLGALQMGDSLSLPIATEDLLTGGLWALYLSYIALFIAVVAWVVDKASASDEGRKILEKG